LSASATDIQIDRLVYELYDLMEEEVRIVEGMNKWQLNYTHMQKHAP
jgi:hypothetical protein